MGESAGRVSCPKCGKTYRWREQYAGKKVRCKACGGVIAMPVEPPQTVPRIELMQPGESAAADGGDALIDRCPSCGNHVKPGAVICINCGYNIREGKQLETAVSSENESGKKSWFPLGKKAKPEEGEKPAKPDEGEKRTKSKSIQERLADGDDEVRPSKLIDIYLPLILIAIGFGVVLVELLVLPDWILADAGLPGTEVFSVGEALLLLAVYLVVNVILMLVGLHAAAWVLGVSYGPLLIGLLKLSGIALGAGAIGDVVILLLYPSMGFVSFFPGWFVTLIAFWILVSKLFDLDANDAIGTIVIMAVVWHLTDTAASHIAMMML